MPTTTERITKTPGVCGGSACIRNTRITVWGLAAYRRLGMSDAEILQAVHGLNPADLQAAWHYAAANAEEIDRDIEEIGRTAAQLLLDRLGEGGDRPAQRISFPTRLILGGSCAAVGR